MVGCLLFAILVVLAVAFFPVCAMILGGGAVLSVAVVVDWLQRWTWVVLLLALAVPISFAVWFELRHSPGGRRLAAEIESVTRGAGRAVEDWLRRWAWLLFLVAFIGLIALGIWSEIRSLRPG